MINFNNYPNPPKKISEMSQSIQIGDKVRCYNDDTNDLNHFVGYAYVTEIIDIFNNYHWCMANVDDFDNGFLINYAFFVVKV